MRPTNLPYISDDGNDVMAEIMLGDVEAAVYEFECGEVINCYAHSYDYARLLFTTSFLE